MISFAIRASAATLLISSALPQESEDPLRRSVVAEYMRVAEILQEGSVSPHWIEVGPDEFKGGFWFLRDGTQGPRIFVMTTDRPEPRELFDLARVRASFAAASGEPMQDEGLPFRDFEFLKDGLAVRFRSLGSHWRLWLEDSSIEAMSDVEKVDPDTPRVLRPAFAYGNPPPVESISPDGTTFLGDDEQNLYVRQEHSDEMTWLTTDGAEHHGWASQGATWSSTGSVAAAARADLRHTPRVPIVDWLQKNARVEEHPYCKSGQDMAITEMHLFHLDSGHRVRVSGTGQQNQMEFPIGFRPGDQEFWMLRTDRLLKSMRILAVDVLTGETRTVLQESSETFIGGLDFYLIRPDLFRFHGDGGEFLWLSERDGFRHVYLYAPDGTLLRQLSGGAFPVRKIERSDAAHVWFHATIDHPYESQLCRVPIAGGDTERLTQGEGEHTVQFSPDGTLFLDTWMSPTEPPRTELRRANGEFIGDVVRADATALLEGGYRPPEEFTVLADDGVTTLYGQIYKPRDFDPSGSYPVLDAIYGGPFVQWLARGFGDYRSIENNLFADLGFVVIAVDSRGTVGRGKEFQDAIYRNWGGVTIPDHAAVLRQLGERYPWFDTDRVGIFGGSWGGYFTVRAMVAHPDVFHAGVATNPVVDLEDHASVPIEPYVGLPDGDDGVYAAGSCLKLAGQLEGELLLIHGTSDVNATVSATMKMVAALIEADKEFEVALVPNADHALQGDVEGAMEWAHRKERRFFVEHLRPAARGR